MKNIWLKESTLNICAGIVLYNPEMERLAENISSIISQVKTVVLVDNGSANICAVQERWGNMPNIVFIKNEKNQGIAKALNQMCEWAMNNDFDWILTLDQDSVCDCRMIEKLQPYTRIKEVGIICPRVEYENVTNKTRYSSDYQYVEACMTSASLTSIKSWQECCGFDEWMFIDYVDNDFCMRLKLHSYFVIRVNTVVLYHQLGQSKEILLLFKIKVIVNNHNNIRNYYYTRNSIYYMKKYTKHINIYKQILILLHFESKKIIFEKKKILTIKSFINGFVAGVRSKPYLEKTVIGGVEK